MVGDFHVVEDQCALSSLATQPSQDQGLDRHCQNHKRSELVVLVWMVVSMVLNTALCIVNSVFTPRSSAPLGRRSSGLAESLLPRLSWLDWFACAMHSRDNLHCLREEFPLSFAARDTTTRPSAIQRQDQDKDEDEEKEKEQEEENQILSDE